MAIQGNNETLVNSYTTGAQYQQLMTALSDGGWVVTWLSYNQVASGENDIFQMRFDEDGQKVGGPADIQVNIHTDNGQAYQRVVGLPDGGWVVVWHSEAQDAGDDETDSGVYMQVYDANGAAKWTSDEQVNATTAASQRFPEIAVLDDGSWIVVWDSFDQDGDDRGVFMRRYDENGASSGPDIQVNTAYTSGAQYGHKITALANGGWVITWHSASGDGNGLGVFQQAYDSEGDPLYEDGEIQVNEYITNTQAAAETVALAGGGWVVVWESEGQDGSGRGVYQQAYDSDGNALDVGETRVHTTDTGNQSRQTVAALSGGGWVVLWTGHTSVEDEDEGIYIRAFNADGTALTAEIALFSGDVNTTMRPQVIGLNNGGWVAVWEEDDGDLAGIFQQAFDAEGNPLDDPMRVNQETADGQHYPKVTLLDDGGWVVSWQGPDANGAGIYQRVFHLDDEGPSGPTNGPDFLNGTSNRDIIDGLGGKDTIHGRGGNDLLKGSNGNDKLFGDNGNDTLKGGNNNDTLNGGAGVDILFGGAGSDILKGGSGSDKLKGEGGIDTLLGGNGNDVLIGGKGNDKLTGNGGRDTFKFGKFEGKDVVTDFQNGKDKLDLSGFNFSNKSQALKHFGDAGGNHNDKVFFSHKGTEITVKGIDLKDLGGDDVLV